MKMIPSSPYEGANESERRIFELCRASLNDSWFCFHSFELPEHLTQRSGEGDFVLLGPAGLFVIEVKGHRKIIRKFRQWFSGRDGQTLKELEKDPFKQAKENFHSLRKRIVEKSKFSGYLPGGHGVAFPNTKISSMGKALPEEWPDEVVYDQSDSSFESYLNDLFGYWAKKDKNRKLNLQQVEIITHYLLGDLQSSVSLSKELQDTEDAIKRFSLGQQHVLEQLRANKRVIVEGAAGTGKTVLAMDYATQLAKDSVKTLYLCFNKKLAFDLRSRIDLTVPGHKVDVQNIHAYMDDVIKKSEFAAELERKRRENGEDFYTVVYPELYSKAMQTQDTDKYKVFIMDEAQDYMTDNLLMAFGDDLESGMSDGRWAIFLDSENQRKCFSKFDEQVYRELQAYHPAMFPLGVNFRNTDQIGSFAEDVSGFDAACEYEISGKDVEIIATNAFDDLPKKIKSIVRELHQEGIEYADIAVLAPIKYAIRKVLSANYPFPISDQLENEVGVVASTVQSFKGLEARVVILLAPFRVDEDVTEQWLYIAATRARNKLYVVCSERDKERIRELTGFRRSGRKNCSRSDSVSTKGKDVRRHVAKGAGKASRAERV